MGQKIHPLGLRLGITQNHQSYWFASPNQYAEFLKEDRRIRQCIENYVQDYMRDSANSSYGYSGIARVEIKRDTELIHVEIHTAGFPAILAKNQSRERVRATNSTKNIREKLSTRNQGQELEKLWRYVQENLTSQHGKFRMTLSKVINPYKEANIVAEYIARQLENRVAFRRAMKQAIKDAKKNGQVKGIKIQISGRLNGAEIARVEWAREGRVSLQTLRAKIDYCHYPAHTKYGVLGIKVWIFEGDSWSN
jgi:small subunit ribosomal protein S3